MARRGQLSLQNPPGLGRGLADNLLKLKLIRYVQF